MYVMSLADNTICRPEEQYKNVGVELKEDQVLGGQWRNDANVIGEREHEVSLFSAVRVLKRVWCRKSIDIEVSRSGRLLRIQATVPHRWVRNEFKVCSEEKKRDLSCGFPS